MGSIFFNKSFNFLLDYKKLNISELYSYLGLNIIIRMEVLSGLRIINAININSNLNIFSFFINVVFNPFYYSYYNQNVITRVSKTLSIAARNEVKKIKLLLN